MELSGTNEARLWKLGDEGKPSGTELQLERRSDSLAFAGAWEGKRDNRAGLDLKIEDADGKISGTALLYFQVGPALPLLSPRAEGNILMFEIQRRKCTRCDEPGANSKFLVQLTGPNEASLWMWTDGEIDTHRAPDVKLVRHADSASWHDPSAHHVQFVVVEYGARIEVLDWGGTGRNVVLLAGSGNTGHVFDDFAAKLNSFCHVYAITRRGYGESSHPDAGYTEERLAEDVLQVLDSLKIVAPVVAGHSAGGGELTRLGDEHSDRIAGLVYLDAAFDPADFPAANPAYMALFHNLPEALRNRPPQAATDKNSFRAYRDWRVRNGEVNLPESELRNQFATNSDGSVGAYKATTPFIHEAFGNGALKRDYSNFRVPIPWQFSLCPPKIPMNQKTLRNAPPSKPSTRRRRVTACAGKKICKALREASESLTWTTRITTSL
jgi:pimeloyl-ACP methyl ester carboxylesterase